jgi:tetratricopeptide (TPR) repeat protein
MLDRRRRGIPTRPGSVAEARAEAGLSLAELAGGKVTRQAIHLIEKGKARPSRETLQWIAHRTNKPFDFFRPASEVSEQPNEQNFDLIEIELLAAQRRFDEVLTRVAALLDSGPPSLIEAALRLRAGEAHCRLHHPEPALEHLRRARALAAQAGDEVLIIESLDWTAGALSLRDDPTAMSILEEAIARCRALDTPHNGLLARLLQHLGLMQTARGAWRQAVSTYDEAVIVGRAVVDLHDLARMHDGLAHSYQRMGQPARALTHSMRALTLYEAQADRQALCRAENNIGDILLRQGQLEEAEQHLLRALAMANDLGVDRRGRAYILDNLADLALRRDDLDEAERFANDALELAETSGEQIVMANCEARLARIAHLRGGAGLADEMFQRAVARLTAAEVPERLADVLMEYAETLEARGDLGAASRIWRQAAQTARALSPGEFRDPERSVAQTAVDSAG